MLKLFMFVLAVWAMISCFAVGLWPVALLLFLILMGIL